MKFRNEGLPRREEGMPTASDLLPEVEEILHRERVKGAQIESAIQQVLDSHNVEDRNERIRLSAEIGVEHANARSKRAMLARADRAHEATRKREERMKLI